MRSFIMMSKMTDELPSILCSVVNLLPVLVETKKKREPLDAEAGGYGLCVTNTTFFFDDYKVHTHSYFGYSKPHLYTSS